MPIAALPEIRPSVGELGQMRHPQWSQALPLRASVVDQQAALAGAGCVTPGATKATYGTGVFVLAHAGERPPPDTGGALLPTVAWQRDGEPPAYALDGGVFTAGALMDWLARDLGLAADAAALATLAETVPDAGGVCVLPALAGLGAPHWRPEARAVVAGLSGASRPAHVAHAALDAIAQRVADIVEAMADAGAAPDVLRVDGGLTQSPLLLQRQADLLGLPVQRGAIDATVFGAVALAAVGAGLWPSIDAIVDHVGAGERIAPSLDAHARLRERAAWTGFVERAATL